jgi:magnesium-transporting ATPase (P-type)
VAWRNVDEELCCSGSQSALDPLTLLPLDGSCRSPYRLAMTGRALTALHEAVRAGSVPHSVLQRAILNAAVFARMSPEAKALLVTELQGTGLYVGMIGDGANDSMALRAAHVGISLSAVEASVAAPFTSAEPTIEAICTVLAEGRGALATSFCLFQFMALYSTIQFSNALLIVFSNSFMSNNMYLYQDLWVVFILSLTLGSTPSAGALGRKRPSGRLFSAYNLAITLVFISTTFLLQYAAVAAVQQKPWYGSESFPLAMDPAEDAEGTNSAIPETTAVFIVASFQYVACGVIFSVGTPWKQWPTTNRAFCFWMLVISLSALGITVLPTDALYSTLSLQRPPYAWNLELLGIGCAAFLSYFVALGGLAQAKRLGWLAPCECRGPRKAHKVLRQEWQAQWAGALPQSL